MTKLSTTLKKEFFELLPPTIFFFVALHIVTFVRVLMLKGTGISPTSSISIAVAALILGKAVLIADMLPMINRFPNKPLFYNVAWKTGTREPRLLQRSGADQDVRHARRDPHLGKPRWHAEDRGDRSAQHQGHGDGR